MTDSPDSNLPWSAQRMAEIMRLDPDQAEAWQDHELAAMLLHRLTAPIQFDLASIPPGRAAQLKDLAAAEGLLVRSLHALFQAPHPPLPLLRLTKDYARANMEDPAGPLPRPVATVLYYLAIAVAMLRCGRRITRLSHAELSRGFQWTKSQSWVNPETLTLIEQAESLLQRPQEPHA